MRKLLAGILFASLAAWAAPASAITFSGTFTVTAHSSGDGLLIQTAPINPSSSVNFELVDPGNWVSIPLFKIWTNETSVDPDDFVAQDIKVGFNFTSPEFSGPGTGETVGHSLLFGLIQWGEVTWNNPTTLLFGSGGKLLVYLSNEIFNEGLFGLDEGTKHGAIVQAKFKLEATPVPIPPAIALFAGGVAAMGLISRRRKRKQAPAAAA